MMQTLDMQMLGRFSECVGAHPGSQLLVQAPSKTPTGATNLQRAIRGELTHLMVKRGPLLVVQWVETANVQWLFDAYA